MTRVLGLLFLSSCAHGPVDGRTLDEPPEDSARIAASVGGYEIYDSEVAGEMEHGAQSRSRALKALIERSLLNQAATAAGVVVSTDARDQALMRWKSRYPTRAEQRSALTAAGKTLHQIRAELLAQLRLDALLTQRGLLMVSKAAIARRYRRDRARYLRPKRIRAQHILFRGPSSPDQKRRVASARRALRRGRSFAAVARSQGDGRSSERGGDLGWFAKGTFDPTFEGPAFSAKVGALIEIRNRQGLHLTRVKERQAASRVPLEQAAGSIAAELRAEGRRAGRRRLLSQLRKSTPIVIRRP